MDAEIKHAWVEALRSGKYQQTRGVLNRVFRVSGSENGAVPPPGYCCLGVLVDVVHPEWWIEGEDQDGARAFVDPREGSIQIGGLSNRLLDEVGFSHSTHGALTHMNDNGQSFEDIAAWIESNL